MAEPQLAPNNFLNRLSPRVQDKLYSQGEWFRYGAGEYIFREHDPSIYLYIVEKGHVAVDIHIPSKGKRSILTAGPGDLISWSALVEPRIHTASARAVEQTEVHGIKGATLMALCKEDPELGYELYRNLAEVVSARLTATRLQLLDMFSAA